MRQVTRKGLMTMAAATGVIAAAGGAAHADSGAYGSSSDSPGVLSGNTVQAPVHVPVNICGNTVDVVGILNPAMGTACVNQGGGSSGGHGDSQGSGGSGSHGGSHGGSHADGHATDSPGVGSGNHVEVPVHVPVNVCGNSVDVVGALNPTTGNDCANGGGGDHSTPPGGDQETPPEEPGNPGNPENPGNPDHPGAPDNPPGPDDETAGGSPHVNQPVAHTVTQPRGTAQLARTGSDLPLGLALPVGAGALLAGTVLYRKARASA
ncbi:chaplin [Streptomyces lancefieldiae]|uniref:Chaplin family protein n=1 Tax=Streptomyces lancefieldiae TaxID=3075520 RepID=A0ABU3AMA8_9ACTN|nr:chaplin family protein [Streptomyces sp. DSM 40712]MDT0611318.1 chaplin family protein [Streptomyces sp. DSM 40712]